MAVMLTFRDKQKKDRVDMGVFNAGHIEGNSPVRRELARAFRARPNMPPLQGEKFFFYYDSDIRQNDSHKFIAQHGGGIVDVVTGNGEHGVLFTGKSEKIRNRIVDEYDALAAAAIPARNRGRKHAAAE